MPPPNSNPSDAGDPTCWLDEKEFLDLVFLEYEGWAVTRPSRRLRDVAAKSDDVLRDELRAGDTDWDFDSRILRDWARFLESGQPMDPLTLRATIGAERPHGALYIKDGNHRALALARALARGEHRFQPVAAILHLGSNRHGMLNALTHPGSEMKLEHHLERLLLRK